MHGELDAFRAPLERERAPVHVGGSVSPVLEISARAGRLSRSPEGGRWTP